MTHEHGSAPGGSSEPRKQWQPSLAHWFIMIALLMLIQAVFSRPRAETLAYSDFKTLVAVGKVRNVLVEQRTISGQRVRDSGDSVGGVLTAARLAELLTSAIPCTLSRPTASRIPRS